MALGVAGALLAVIGFAPQFGGVGYEFSLACGLVLPSCISVATALTVSRERLAPRVATLRGLRFGAAMAGAALMVGLAHGLRGGICDFWGGVTTFALCPGAGALLAGLWGSLCGQLAMALSRRRRLAVALALLAPAACVAISVWRFYASPMVFAFDPFVGFFSGTLYDTVVDAGPPLVTYRAGSLATLAACVLLAGCASREDGANIRFRRNFWRLAAGLTMAAISVAVTLSGPKLGHWQTPSSIARELGGERAGARCDVIYPRTLRDEDAALLAKDCDEQIASAEAALGARGPDRIVAFFFRDAAEKRRLMGAADTYIAKPWRREVYLQVASYPHPVLGHEIAHAVAGAFGQGPFRIAGEARGLWPNPGLIEGVAVAVSPDEDELTDMEWAAAMKKKGKLPALRSIFSVEFLGQSAAKSYTVAGAFIRWVLGTRGPALVRAWYGGASFEALMGQSWSSIEADFGAALDSLALPPAAEAYVDSKFERPSVWRRRCPHVVDALRRSADACRDSHDRIGAREGYAGVLERDEHDFAARFALGALELREGDSDRGRGVLEALASGATPLSYQHKAREALADQAFRQEHWQQAADAYRALAAATPDEDAARTLEVKALAASTPEARAAVLALLIGEAGRAQDVALASARLGAWEAASGAPLASYLLGKSIAQRGSAADAAPYLDRALEHLESLPARVGREAVRQRSIAACVLGDDPAKARMKALIAGEKSPFSGSAGGRREVVANLLARCR